MKTSLTEIVDVILKHIEANRGKPQSEKRLRTLLIREGYSLRDIDDAINIVRPTIQSTAPGAASRPLTARRLTAYEQFKLTPAARDAIARLELYEIIDSYERELLLDRLMQYEGEVGMEELDYLLSFTMLNTRDLAYQQTVYNVMLGSSRRTLH